MSPFIELPQIDHTTALVRVCDVVRVVGDPEHEGRRSSVYCRNESYGNYDVYRVDCRPEDIHTKIKNAIKEASHQ